MRKLCDVAVLPVVLRAIRTMEARTISVSPAQMTDAGGQSIAPQLSEIDVVIRDATRPLWQGTLRVADRGMTSNWSETRNEPPRQPCPRRPYGWIGEGEALSLSLGARAREVPASMAVQMKWTRRGAAACDGVRTVEVRQTVIVASGKPTIITADGGLRVELRRR